MLVENKTSLIEEIDHDAWIGRPFWTESTGTDNHEEDGINQGPKVSTIKAIFENLS